MKKEIRIVGCAAMIFGGFFVGGVMAQEQVVGSVEEGVPGWWEGEGITGDWWGGRTALGERGVEVFGGYTVDIFGNTTGGIRRGVEYSGLLDFGVDVDLEEAVGWKGGSISTTWLWLSGRDASEQLVGNFLTISNIAGLSTLRMLELWVEQELFDGVVSIRAGQLAADSEFVISDYAGLFINGTFGWPSFVYMNLPEGGPGYPMGTLGVRLAIQPVEWFTFLSAAFQGDVFAQDVNRHGFRYRLDASTGYTFLNEAQVRWNQGEGETGLPGQWKAGVWLQSGRFADALADSTRSGNVGAYMVVDQMLLRQSIPSDGKTIPSDGKTLGEEGGSVVQTDKGLGSFARIALAPADRNFVNFYFDAGLSYKGLLPGRDEDVVGIAFGCAAVSGGARSAIDAEGERSTGAEMVLEATYQAQVTSWLVVQPDVQFIINPGATRSVGNALLLGVRAAVNF